MSYTVYHNSCNERSRDSMILSRRYDMTRQNDCQLSVHTNIITVYCNLVNLLVDFNLSGSI